MHIANINFISFTVQSYNELHWQASWGHGQLLGFGSAIPKVRYSESLLFPLTLT